MRSLKALVAVVLFAVLFQTASVPAHALSADYNVKVIVNGQQAPAQTKPYIKNGLTMVPLRFISETLGAAVHWNEQTRDITIQSGGSTISMKTGSKLVQSGSSRIELETAPELAGSYTMVPLRFVSSSLGAQVHWEERTRTVQIYTGSDPIAQEPEEMRAAWISTVHNIDWPSKPGLTAEEQKNEYITMLDALQNAGMNAVIVQVRPQSDAIYPSSLVPWSKSLTGKQGEHPGYDPLAFMIEETHRRGMQFHAWFNPFRANADMKANSLVKEHPASLHPEWTVAYNNQLLFNPGLPEARQHIISAIMEVVHNYPVDGVHLDDYFYPYPANGAVFNDDDTFQKHKGAFSNKAEWRRHNVNTFVKDLNQAIKTAKPQVAFGISPFGIWRNSKDDPTGSDTNGLSAYDTLYADARSWIRNGWIDYIAPQLYWSIGNKPADYGKLVAWWANETRGTGVRLYIGQGAYRVGSNTSDWATSDAIISQLQLNRQYPEVAGSLFFSANTFLSNPKGLADSLRQFYSQPQLASADE